MIENILNLGFTDNTTKAIKQLLQFFEASLDISMHKDKWVECLSEEITSITHGCAYFLPSSRRAATRRHPRPDTLLRLTVQCKSRMYGTLCVVADPNDSERPAISMAEAQYLSQICGWLLYALELSLFIEGQCRQLDYQVFDPLTRREREILLLMCKGHKQEAIAAILSISPVTVAKHRQHIYEQLGVHCEQDALLAAYHTGLFSIVEA